MTILVGTASWADKSLVDSGKFYPPEVTSPEERLRYYASQFPMVEVDSSYYAMPLPATTQQWAERTPSTSSSTSRRFGSSPATRVPTSWPSYPAKAAAADKPRRSVRSGKVRRVAGPAGGASRRSGTGDKGSIDTSLRPSLAEKASCMLIGGRGGQGFR